MRCAGMRKVTMTRSNSRSYLARSQPDTGGSNVPARPLEVTEVTCRVTRNCEKLVGQMSLLLASLRVSRHTYSSQVHWRSPGKEWHHAVRGKRKRRWRDFARIGNTTKAASPDAYRSRPAADRTGCCSSKRSTILARLRPSHHRGLGGRGDARANRY